MHGQPLQDGMLAGHWASLTLSWGTLLPVSRRLPDHGTWLRRRLAQCDSQSLRAWHFKKILDGALESSIMGRARALKGRWMR